jgi:hypothetical protein
LATKVGDNEIHNDVANSIVGILDHLIANDFKIVPLMTILKLSIMKCILQSDSHSMGGIRIAIFEKSYRYSICV